MGSHRLPDEDASSLKQGKFRSFIDNFWEYCTPLEKLSIAVVAITITGAGLTYGAYKSYKYVRNHNAQQAVTALYALQEQEFEQFIVRPLRLSFQQNLEGKLLPGKRLPFETKPTIDEIATSLESTFIYSLKKPVTNNREIITRYEEKNKPVQELSQILIELEMRGYNLEATSEAKSWTEKYVNGTLIPTLAYLKKRSPQIYAQVKPDLQLINAQIENAEKLLQIPKGKFGLYIMLNDKLKFTAQRKYALARNEALIKQSNNPVAQRLERELEYLRQKDTLNQAIEAFKPRQAAKD